MFSSRKVFYPSHGVIAADDMKGGIKNCRNVFVVQLDFVSFLLWSTMLMKLGHCTATVNPLPLSSWNVVQNGSLVKYFSLFAPKS